MHPVMSDHDIAVRQFERTMDRRAHQHRLLVNHVAHQNGRSSLVSRLVRAIHQVIDPRGFALRQYRLAELAQGTSGSMLVRPAIESAVWVHPLPTRRGSEQPPVFREAA